LAKFFIRQWRYVYRQLLVAVHAAHDFGRIFFSISTTCPTNMYINDPEKGSIALPEGYHDVHLVTKGWIKWIKGSWSVLG